MQVEAAAKVKELFPNLSDLASEEIAALVSGLDDATREEAVEDPEAGFTGMPFTQPEHDEEWCE